MTAVAFQQVLYAMAWLASVRLVPDNRYACWHWALFGVGSAVSVGLLAWRGQGPDWLAVGVCDFVFIATVVIGRRASELFFGQTTRDHEHAAVLALTVIGLSLIGVQPEHTPWRVGLVCVLVLGLVARAMMLTHASLAREFGRRRAKWVHLPLALLVLIFVVRGVWTLRYQEVSTDLPQTALVNQVLLFSILMVSAFIHMAYGGMLVHRLTHRVQFLLHHDELTGLSNRRAVDEALQREWDRWQRFHTAFALIRLDVDQLRTLDERHGAGRADAAMVTVAKVLVSILRPTDVAARVAGDEFLILLPGTDEQGAVHAAERLQSLIGAQRLSGNKGLFGLSASLGVAGVRAKDRAGSAVDERAKRAHYRAKHMGRKRVWSDGAPEAGPLRWAGRGARAIAVPGDTTML